MWVVQSPVAENNDNFDHSSAGPIKRVWVMVAEEKGASEGRDSRRVRNSRRLGRSDCM